jgi:CheY-like chemotaxis protein
MSQELKGRRIFIVEDNLTNRAIMQLMIEQHGGAVAFERWGQDTVERLRGFMPADLILLDLMFPGGVTGYDIFDRIRADESFAHIPIVAVSASDPSTSIPLTKQKGFTGFISKPIEYELFVKQMLKILAGQPVWYAGT